MVRLLGVVDIFAEKMQSEAAGNLAHLADEQRERIG
jgi:hypothetical protein